MNESHDLVPIPVYLHNIESLAAAVSRPRRYHYNITFRTIVLTAGGVGQSIRPLCADDPSREYLLVQAFTNDVVLCESQSRAQDPANSVVGLPNPEGFLLWHTNVTATRIDSQDLIWVVAASFPAQVTVQLVNRVEVA